MNSNGDINSDCILIITTDFWSPVIKDSFSRWYVLEQNRYIKEQFLIIAFGVFYALPDLRFCLFLKSPYFLLKFKLKSSFKVCSCEIESISCYKLAHFQPHFCTSIKLQKAFSFLIFPGGIEVEHWLKMGQNNLNSHVACGIRLHFYF